MSLMWLYVDYRRLYYVMLSILTLFMSDINSKTSTHWFLNEIKEQVVPGWIRRNNETPENCQYCESDRGEINCVIHCNSSFDVWDPTSDSYGHAIMRILGDKSRVYYDNDSWKVHYSSKFSSYHMASTTQDKTLEEDPIYQHEPPRIPKVQKSIPKASKAPKIVTHSFSFSGGNYQADDTENETIQMMQKRSLLISCSPYVNQTQYDHLNGIHNRDSFKFFPEPEVALMFFKITGSDSNFEINLNHVEEQLLEDKRKKPKSSNVFNSIGNYLRIHGESREAVECFRYALRLSPHNPDVLLNMARVLYNQNFLEDAIYLTRHSLETQPRNRNPWLQHFTLGEFLRSTGHKQEAQYHFLQSLEFNPGFSPAKDYLKEFSVKSNAVNIVYSFCISVFLLSLVLYIAFLNLEFYNTDNENQKPHRQKSLKTLHGKSRNRRYP